MCLRVQVETQIIEPMTTALDARIDIVTPENIAFQYRVAGPFRRLPAYLIDFLLRAAILLAAGLVLLFVFGNLGAIGMGMGLFLVCWFILGWFYGGLFETFWNGQTPGKRWTRLRVLTTEGQPISALQAVLRNILRFADAMPVIPLGADNYIPLYMVGLFTATTNSRFQRLGDLACGTIVVVEERQRFWSVLPVTDPGATRLAGELPPNCIVSRSLARALSMYVSRRRHFSPARRIEIARTLGEPLCVRFGLPPRTDPDLLLCALYLRTFFATRGQILAPPAAAEHADVEAPLVLGEASPVAGRKS